MKPIASSRIGIPCSFSFSILGSLFFSVFNGVLGIANHSIWSMSICVYYILLTILRGASVFFLAMAKAWRVKDTTQKKICRVIHLILLVANMLLVGPLVLMVMGERDYRFGLIPAIAMATFTTYRIVYGALQFRASAMGSNRFAKELRLINLEDALVSVLTLQNALIIANGDEMKLMISLTSWTSAGIWLLIVILTISAFGKKDEEDL